MMYLKGERLLILSKVDLKEYMEKDKVALGIKKKFPIPFTDEIWRFERLLRQTEYVTNLKKGFWGKIIIGFYKIRFHRLSLKLGFTIPLNVFGKGLSIAHYGTIVVNSNARIGNYCRIQDSTTIGATNGSSKAPEIGDHCFIGSGARIIGNIKIADGVCIGANAVIIKDILENNTTWAGIPGKKVSDKGAQSNLLIEDKE